MTTIKLSERQANIDTIVQVLEQNIEGPLVGIYDIGVTL